MPPVRPAPRARTPSPPAGPRPPAARSLSPPSAPGPPAFAGDASQGPAPSAFASDPRTVEAPPRAGPPAPAPPAARTPDRDAGLPLRAAPPRAPRSSSARVLASGTPSASPPAPSIQAHSTPAPRPRGSRPPPPASSLPRGPRAPPRTASAPRRRPAGAARPQIPAGPGSADGFASRAEERGRERRRGGSLRLRSSHTSLLAVAWKVIAQAIEPVIERRGARSRRKAALLVSWCAFRHLGTGAQGLGKLGRRLRSVGRHQLHLLALALAAAQDHQIGRA